VTGSYPGRDCTGGLAARGARLDQRRTAYGCVRRGGASGKSERSVRTLRPSSRSLSSAIAWKGETYTELRDLHLLERFREHLIYACYIVLASHTGMRASEIGAMQTDCLETAAIGGARPLLFVRSRLFKTATNGDGVETSWVAGRDRVAHAVQVAEKTVVHLARTARRPVQDGRRASRRARPGSAENRLIKRQSGLAFYASRSQSPGAVLNSFSVSGRSRRSVCVADIRQNSRHSRHWVPNGCVMPLVRIRL
jgi:integrase